MADDRSREAQREELAKLRDMVRCEVVLEKEGFRLDREATAQRSARNLKFRRGEGEIIIVNHDGKGWWDATNPDQSARGDVFKLIQHFDPSKNLGHVRRELRDLVGIEPSYEVRERTKPDAGAQDRKRDPAWMWDHRNPPQAGSAAWRYLSEQRGLPERVLEAAVKQNLLREGPNGTAWFAHRDNSGALSGMEMRGPEYRGFSTGGIGKRLFRFEADPGAPPSRIVVAEAAIDALSFAATDRFARNSVYLSTAGGMSPESLAEFRQVLSLAAKQPDSRLIIAVDNDRQGDHYARMFTAIAQEAGLWSGRLSPKEAGSDWNQVLRARGGKDVEAPRPFGELASAMAPAPTKPTVASGWVADLGARSDQTLHASVALTEPAAQRSAGGPTPGGR
ncbi:DUF3991 and TOPRIM domain-containing protein [Acetobacter sacchari]|uniref:DUF3991 and TOPRIM domain-containing protein n=1 Tax=Acetobacter sacchari TaxID=2661687 RepID=A0ABS3LWH6_9PROT|nr:DUF3991 and TOPRIM domain-containing protein [Acetobacter sacchari]